jgi:hypothetical protein
MRDQCIAELITACGGPAWAAAFDITTTQFKFDCLMHHRAEVERIATKHGFTVRPARAKIGRPGMRLIIAKEGS